MSRRRWTNHCLKSGAAMTFALLISACSTSKDELLPHGNQTMMEVWEQGTSGASNRQLVEARQALRRPLEFGQKDKNAYNRTAQNEIYSQFKRLPNPDLVMYVFPHLAGSDPAPIPGYSTVFTLYQRVQYAMPGERTEDY